MCYLLMQNIPYLDTTFFSNGNKMSKTFIDFYFKIQHTVLL